MSSRLLTIEGVYDGKSIKPLEAVKTDKKHRVLITFLDEIESPSHDTFHHKDKQEFADIPEDLLQQLQLFASATGVEDLRSFVLGILEEKVQAEKDKEFVFQVTDEIRAGLDRAGLSEEQVLDDFNQFRRNLAREQATLND
jgi:hypothetical protein